MTYLAYALVGFGLWTIALVGFRLWTIAFEIGRRVGLESLLPPRRVLRDGKLVCRSCHDEHPRPLEALCATCDCEFRAIMDENRAEFDRLVPPPLPKGGSVGGPVEEVRH